MLVGDNLKEETSISLRGEGRGKVKKILAQRRELGIGRAYPGWDMEM